MKTVLLPWLTACSLAGPAATPDASPAVPDAELADAPTDAPPPPDAPPPSPLILTDRGPMRLEEEYLPGVVDCELSHFTQALPALEAQAIAARTYLARYLELRGKDAPVGTTSAFQCWRPPAHARSREAAARTRGLVMRHGGHLINANYAAGAPAFTGDATCTPAPPFAFGYPQRDWDEVRAAFVRGLRFGGVAWTQIHVTNNHGRTGDDVRATGQRNYGAPNRGSFGQRAAACLAERQHLDAAEILRRFYGDDVELGPLESW